jgi:4-amino-4-deoxy-L-arabinose transferase-like glycosyltransferase
MNVKTPRWKRSAVWYAAILLFAAALRIPRLGDRDLWTDEINTITTAVSGEWDSGPMYRTAPLNFMLTAWAVRILGPNELGARIVPFLVGLLTVALVYPVFRRRIGSRAALFAMAIVALSIWHIFWSQTARHFALEVLLLLLALSAFLAYWFDGRRAGLAGAALLTLAALFTHSSAGFYLAAFLAFVAGSWIVRRVRARGTPGNAEDGKHFGAVAAFSLVFLAYLPVYISVGTYTLAHRTAWNPPWNIAGSLAFYMPAFLCLAALAGALFLMREGNDLGPLLLVFIAAPVFLVVLASVFTIASGSYCLASILAAAALAGTACDRLLALAAERRRTVPVACVVAGLFAMLVYDAALYHGFQNGLKPRWRDACAFVAAHRAPGDLVLADEEDVARFYLGNEGLESFGKYAKKMDRDDFPPGGPRGVWYVIYVSDSPILRKNPATLRSIMENGRLAASFPLHYGPKDRTLMVFHQEAAPPVGSR